MKIALVTGASSGMGRETVIQLADRFGGLDEIWAVARRENRLEELEEEIPVRLRKFALDVTDEAQLEILRQALKAEHPQVRILVNAAGYGKIGPVGSHCKMCIRDRLEAGGEAFDIIFMDPPYDRELERRVLTYLSDSCLADEDTLIIAEASPDTDFSYLGSLGFGLLREKTYKTNKHVFVSKGELS